MSRTFSYITSKSHAINQIVHIENFSGDFSFPFFASWSQVVGPEVGPERK